MRPIRTDDQAPWKRRFRLPWIWGAWISRLVPTRGFARTNRTGVPQVYAWDIPAGHLRQITDRPGGLHFPVYAPDGGFVYYLADLRGNEIGHYVRVPREGGQPEDITPDVPPYSSFNLRFSGSGNLLGFTVTDAAGTSVWCLNLGRSGILSPPLQLYRSTALLDNPVFSYDGALAVVCSSERSGKQQFCLVAIDVNTRERINELWDGPDTSIETLGFARFPGDDRLLARSNRTGVFRPLIWRVRTGERTDLAVDHLAGDVSVNEWSNDGRRLLLRQISYAATRFWTYDLGTHTVLALDSPPGGYYGMQFIGPGEIMANWDDSTHPPQVIALDDETGRYRRTVLKAEEPPPARPWRSVTFASTDGQGIQAWLVVPEGPGPFPAVIHTHGGPHAVQTEEWHPSSQAWVDHGFAFLSINYRGSTTFGRSFQERIWGDLGHWEVEDCVAARQWLIREGLAHADQIFLTGWSYGGYLTLQALGAYPDLWAGGMAGTAIADWIADYEDTTERLRQLRAPRFGGTPQQNPAQYAKSSPITSAEQVNAPVLIIQARDDTRTPPRGVEMYERKMKALGKDIEVHWVEGGHVTGPARVEREIEHQELMLQFAYRVLAAR